jgi:DNA-binding transcriptional MerR regulator
MRGVTGDVTFKLDDLARAAGTSARTVRYYVQRGLLPAPAFRGKDSAYGREHLVRLRAIRRLQEAFLPLDAIAVELEQRSLAEIERIAEGTQVPSLVVEPGTAPPPKAAMPARTFRRTEVAVGVELSVSADAPLESQRIAEKILELVEEWKARGA